MNQVYTGQNETVTHKGDGYTIEMRENCGNYHTTLIWHKRGRKPAIVEQLRPIFVEPNSSRLKAFRSRSDAMAVMGVLKNYMAEYEAKKK